MVVSLKLNTKMDIARHTCMFLRIIDNYNSLALILQKVVATDVNLVRFRRFMEI